MDPFVDQLKRLCSAYPTRSKWVFVPTHAIGRTLGDRLVLEGSDWANLRFVTPLDVALRMGAPFLVERGIDPSEEGLGPALIMRLLLETRSPEPREQPSNAGYFRPQAHQPQMARALWMTISELRMAGLRATDLIQPLFASPEKHSELGALLAAYEEYLATNKRTDLAGVYDEALLHADWCPIQPEDCWTEFPDVVWTPLQRKLMDLVAMLQAERIVPETLELAGATIPRRLGGVKVVRVKPLRENSLAFLMLGERSFPAHQATSPKAVSLFTAGGIEAEIEEVFRRILASGRALDETEIAVPSERYSTLIWEKACRYDWPVTLAHGIPATLTRPGRALIGLSAWIEDNFAAGLLRRLLQSGDLDVPGRSARLLVRAKAAWGRDTYRLAIGRLIRASETRAERDDIPEDERDVHRRRAEEARELADWIQVVLNAVPAPGPDGLIDLQSLVACALTFVEDSAAKKSALDHAAATAITDALRELRALGEFRCRLDQALRFLKERVDGVNVGADRPRPGHLHVSALARAGLAARRLLFVVGLEEGRVFPTAFEDPVLLDIEREALSPALRRSGDKIDEAVYAALGRLAAASAADDTEICLSYSCRDTREFRDTYASWLLLQAYRVISGQPRAKYGDLHDALGAPKSCVPESADRALGEAGWWLGTQVRSGETDKAVIRDHYPSLAAAAHAETERASDRFTEFDGHVPEAGPVLDPCAPDRVVSPTQLEKAAGCPFRHFLERGLGVHAIESGERDRDVWLDPLMRGTLLHDLYAEFLRRCRDEQRRPRCPADHEWLLKRGTEVLANLAIEMPPPSEEVREREIAGVPRGSRVSSPKPRRRGRSRTPVGLEVGFGRTHHQEDAQELEPLSRSEPVVLDLGHGMKLRIAGRIDRIDQLDETTFEIVDYKTGGYWQDDWQGTFAGGKRLQHALYGLAALEILKSRSRSQSLPAPSTTSRARKGGRSGSRFGTQPLATVAAVLGDLREVIASGLFVHAPDESGCKFCDYGPACGQDAHARASAKLVDPRLAPFVRLSEHE